MSREWLRPDGRLVIADMMFGRGGNSGTGGSCGRRWPRWPPRDRADGGSLRTWAATGWASARAPGDAGILAGALRAAGFTEVASSRHGRGRNRPWRPAVPGNARHRPGPVNDPAAWPGKAAWPRESRLAR